MDNILGSIRREVTTRSRLANFFEFYSCVSSLEPLKVEKALSDLDWIIAMQEELNNFTRNEVWSLVARPKQNVIGTKWVFRTPTPSTVSFTVWWEMIDNGSGDMIMKGVNSLIALGAWIIWNHRNRIVFDGISPSVSAALCQAREEQQLWEMAGAKGLSFLATTIRGT